MLKVFVRKNVFYRRESVVRALMIKVSKIFFCDLQLWEV